MLIERIGVYGLMPAAEAAGISVRTARKWRQRLATDGPAGLADRSSRPHKTRSTVDAELRQRIEQLRRGRMPAFLAYYNSRRPHSALGYKPPASRLGGNNLLQLNSTRFFPKSWLYR